MNWIFTNPAGLWALLGIPALLIIHYLQRQSRAVPVSTLFLLEQTQLESAAGRRFERFTHSVPFWLQVLAVLLLTWILTQPRQIRKNSTQRIAFVLDSSASMQVFQKNLSSVLESHLPTLTGSAQALEFVVIESDLKRPRIYQGNNISELQATLQQWQAVSGTIDPTSSLRVARELVEAEGLVVYLTDTPRDHLPFGAALLALGDPVENCGFTGITYEEQEGSLVWRALIRNYGTTEQTREWFLETPEKQRTRPENITLEPGQMMPLQGVFPSGTTRCLLHLTKDAFPLDDTLAMISPQAKTLNFEHTLVSKYAPFVQKMLAGLTQLKPSLDAAETDLTLLVTQVGKTELPAIASIVVLDETAQAGHYLKGGLLAERSFLMDGLNWQPLLVRESPRLLHDATDEVLLWQGEQALIFLRSQNQLVFNFDLTLSNALKLPATAVLLHRFCNQLLREKVTLERRNLDTGQTTTLATKADQALDLMSENLTGMSKSARTLEPSFKAPFEPGYLTVSQGGEALLIAALNFSDTREADFRSCATADTLASISGTTVTRHTREDRHWRLWVLLLLVVLLSSWKFIKTRT